MDDYPETWPLERPALLLLILVYLVIGAFYAAQTPAWQVPDEPAHYNYIAQLAAGGCCPLMEAGDYDQDYLDALRGARFDPALTARLDTVQYEDHQPPLYYLLQWPVFALSGGSLVAMRLFSVLLGAGVVLLAWAVVRVLFPRRPWMALTSAAFVAFLPQHVAMMAGVNNDSLAELCIGAVLLAGVLCLRAGELDWPSPHPAVLGVLVGLAGLTKTTVFFVAAAAALAAMVLAHRTDRRRMASAVGWVILVSVLLNGLWWLRNAGVYGFPDITGLARHDAVVTGQPRTGEWIAAHGLGGLLERFTRFTFNSFWGQFGWMAVPMPGWMYAALQAFTGMVLVGIVFGVGRNRRKREVVTWGQRAGVALLAFVLLLTAGQYIFYNLTFVQHQGRYLYPALVPIAFGVGLGLDGWMRPLVGRGLPLWVRWLPALGLGAGFTALDVYVLGWVIVPALGV